MTRKEIADRIEELEQIIARYTPLINSAELEIDDLREIYGNMRDFQEALF